MRISLLPEWKLLRKTIFHRGKERRPKHAISIISFSFSRFSVVDLTFDYNLNSSNGSSKALPDMTQQKGIFEAENLKLHLCNSVFEAYSGSYLTTKAHMLKVASESYNLTWVNCEMASFIHMKESRRFYGDPTGEGMIVQSLDVLDFSVIHLSAYERSSKKYKHRIWSTKADLKVAWTKIEPVREAGKILETMNNPLISGQNISWSDEARRTVVIMPFLGKETQI